MRAILLIIVLLTLGGVAADEETDPFAVIPLGVSEKKEIKEEFETTGAFKVVPVRGWIEGIPSEDWPKIESPTNFNRHFDRAFRIWRVDGGYFGAFDGGEWGGALFFAADNAARWTRIIDTHIQDLERFEGDTFLAAGGVAHLSQSDGEAYLIIRQPTGKWQARKIFSSNMGVPRIIGTSATDAFWRANSKKLIVLGLEYPLGSEPFFGVDVSGTIHYIGESTKTTTSESGSRD